MNKRLLLIFLMAAALRLSFVFSSYHGDLNNNISWGAGAVHSGLSGLYERKDWPYSPPNQPPLTILLFTGLQILWNITEKTAQWLNNSFPLFPSKFIWFWEDRGMKLLIKLPSIIGDLGIAYLTYKYFFKLHKQKMAFLTSTLWLFNPIIWFNSSIWGQTDSIVNFLGLWAIVQLFNGELVWFAVLFVLSLLFKGSLAIFVPILVIVALVKKFPVNKWIQAVVFALFTIVAVSIWFHPALDFPFWFLNLYQNRILSGEIGSLTANAFNFWWLVDPGKTLDSLSYFGLSARLWGILISSSFILIMCSWVAKKSSDKRVLLALAISSLAVFLFMTRVHERYLYPFFPVATLLVGLSPIASVIYVLLSISNLLNIYHLFNAASFAPLEVIYHITWLPNFLAVLNIVVLGVILFGFKHKKGYN